MDYFYRNIRLNGMVSLEITTSPINGRSIARISMHDDRGVRTYSAFENRVHEGDNDFIHWKTRTGFIQSLSRYEYIAITDPKFF
jgi:hypothetical protein